MARQEASAAVLTYLWEDQMSPTASVSLVMYPSYPQVSRRILFRRASPHVGTPLIALSICHKKHRQQQQREEEEGGDHGSHSCT